MPCVHTKNPLGELGQKKSRGFLRGSVKLAEMESVLCQLFEYWICLPTSSIRVLIHLLSIVTRRGRIAMIETLETAVNRFGLSSAFDFA